MKRFGVFSLLSLILVSCSFFSDKKTFDSSEKPIILVSVAPYIELIDQISGGTVDVQCAVPPGVDPHNWEPNYQDMDRLQGAVAWFTIGEEFEPRLSKKLYETSPDLVIYSLQQEVPTLPIPNSSHAHDDDDDVHFVDSHFWLDPILDIHQGRFIARVLSAIRPEFSALYTENLKKLEETLLALNVWVQSQIQEEKKTGKYIVTTHGAYTYYCGRYGLYQIVIEPAEGKEPRTQDIARIADQIQRKLADVVGVFLQPEHSNKAAKIIAEKFHLPTYMIDPYQKDYIETIRSLTNAVIAKRSVEPKTSFKENEEKEEILQDLFREHQHIETEVHSHGEAHSHD